MNPHKGEVELRAGDRALILRFSVDALCRLEAATGKGFPVLAEQMSDPKRMTITLIREVLCAGLYQHNPVTIEEAGELIPAAGGLTVVMGKISEALDLAFPQAEGEKPARPPAAPRRVDWPALLRQWVSFGFDPDAYWPKTPREVSLIFAGKSDQFTREHNQRAWLAWHTAALPRAKKFPLLKKLLIRDREPQSAERMLEIAKQWTVALGGEFKGKPN